MDVPFRDLGPKALKNIRDKVRVYEVWGGEPASIGNPATARPVPPRLTLPVATGVAAVVVLGTAAYELAIRRSLAIAPPAPTVVATPVAPTGARPTAEQPVTVGVMTIAARGQVPEWMRDVTRDGLNTIHSRVTGLQVYSRQEIDFLRDKQGLSELEAAEKLGIGKMISGALALQVVDIASGLLDASERVSGDPSQLIELENQLAVNVLRGLDIALSPADATPGATPPPAAPPAPSGHSWLSWPSVVWAESAGTDEEAIRAVLTEWAAALQAKDLARVAAVPVTVDEAQRAALTRYFDSANRLTIAIGDLDVLVAGDEALATFTRKDSFVDKRNGVAPQVQTATEGEVVVVGACSGEAEQQLDPEMRAGEYAHQVEEAARLEPRERVPAEDRQADRRTVGDPPVGPDTPPPLARGHVVGDEVDAAVQVGRQPGPRRPVARIGSTRRGTGRPRTRRSRPRRITAPTPASRAAAADEPCVVAPVARFVPVTVTAVKMSL